MAINIPHNNNNNSLGRLPGVIAPVSLSRSPLFDSALMPLEGLSEEQTRLENMRSEVRFQKEKTLQNVIANFKKKCIVQKQISHNNNFPVRFSITSIKSLNTNRFKINFLNKAERKIFKVVCAKMDSDR